MTTRIATFAGEVARILNALRSLMQSYRLLGNLTAAEQILRIFVKTGSGLTPQGEAKEKLLQQIQTSLRMGMPIPMSLTIAHGLRAPNPLKYEDPFGPPTYAWLHSLFTFLLISERVKCVYQPGMQFFVFEEGHLFDELLEVPKGVVDRNLRMFQRLIDATSAPVTSINLFKEHLPEAEAVKLPVEVLEAEVHAFVCSSPWMNDPEVLGDLYVRGDKPYELIKERVGRARWEEMRQKALRKSQTLALRRHNGIFRHLVKKATGMDVAGRMIDGAITSKEGRLSIKATGGALFNHGMPVVDWRRNTCHIVPQYRIGSDFTVGNRSFPLGKVLISPAEFGEEGATYMWCYESLDSVSGATPDSESK